MPTTYINPGLKPLTFRLGKTTYTVEPGAEFTPPEKYAFAIPMMHIKLVTLEEFTLPTEAQKRRQEAIRVQEEADRKAFEAKEAQRMASHADADAATNASEIAKFAQAKKAEAAEAQAKADQANLTVILGDEEAAKAALDKATIEDVKQAVGIPGKRPSVPQGGPRK
jgi:uncharacterized membrane protein YqiK